MESWIEFGRGPLFRLSFVLMILAIFRVFVSAFLKGMLSSMKLGDANLLANTDPNEKSKLDRTGNDLKPDGFVLSSLRTIIEVAYHLAVIVVPLFVAAHVIQWKKGVGFGWWELPQPIADNITLFVILASPVIILLKMMSRLEQSRLKAFLKPILVAIPFITGYICVNGQVTPYAYYLSMLIHVWVGNFLMLAIGFTNIARSLIHPFEVLSNKIGRKFGHIADPVWNFVIGGSEGK